MFINVRFGDGESLLFNANCKMKVLIENIKHRCQCSPSEIIDLADEQAHVKHIGDHPVDKYATDILTARTNYILIKVTVKTEETQTLRNYQPLLNGLETSNPDFISRLSNRKINPDAAPIRDQRNVVSKVSKKENKLQSGVNVKSGKSTSHTGKQ